MQCLPGAGIKWDVKTYMAEEWGGTGKFERQVEYPLNR
jgi:hypothetical protein